MTATTKIRKIGNSYGVVLPKDMLDKLGLREGDMMEFEEDSTGFTLTRLDKDVDDLMAMAEEIMAENRDVLRALAK